MKKIFALFAAVCILAGCASVKEIPEDLSVAQLIQKGQDAFVSNQNDVAEKYFQAAIQRYGNDPAVYVEVRYELGHMYEKTHHKNEASAMYKEIISLYDGATYGSLPTAYKRLAELGLERIK